MKFLRTVGSGPAPIGPAWPSRSCSASLPSAKQLAEPMLQARFRLRVVVPPPFPEELLDLRHVGAAGYVLDRLVVNADDRGADEGLAVQVGELDLHRRLLARLVFLLRRCRSS